MHYGINPLLLSMQKLGPRMKCACCCLSHYCHCAIWAMLSCHAMSSILHTLTGPVDGASSRVLSSLFPPLFGAGAEYLYPSDCSHTATAPPPALSLSSRRGDTETAVTQTNITTQVLAQQTQQRGAQLILFVHQNITNEKWITSSHLNKIYHSITAPEATTKHWHWSLNLI